MLDCVIKGNVCKRLGLFFDNAQLRKIRLDNQTYDLAEGISSARRVRAGALYEVLWY